MALICRSVAAASFGAAASLQAAEQPARPTSSRSSQPASLEGKDEDVSGDSRTAAVASSGGGAWSADASGRASLEEMASYLHGAGTSMPDVMNTMAALAANPNASAATLNGGGDGAAALGPAASIGVTDSRMPALFVSLAGVYDIAKVCAPFAAGKRNIQLELLFSKHLTTPNTCSITSLSACGTSTSCR